MVIKPRTVFAFMWYATACYILVMGKVLPNFLENICLMLMSFYFGQHVKKGANNGR